MKNIENKYLCAIGNYKTLKIDDYKVGTYDKERDTFSFSNGSYSDYELKFRESLGSNATCVIGIKGIDEINFSNRLY